MHVHFRAQFRDVIAVALAGACTSGLLAQSDVAATFTAEDFAATPKLAQGDLAKVEYRVRLMQTSVRNLQAQKPAVADVSGLSAPGLQRVQADGSIEVHIYLTQAGEAELQALADLGVRITDSEPQYMNAVQAWLLPDQIDQVAALPIVKSIELPGYAHPRTGTVNSEGDARHRANHVREVPHGVNGTGVRVGVISTGVVGMAAAQAAGDLPAGILVDPNNPGGPNQGVDAEGTAMMEIVHDLAPGAALQFSGPANNMAMVNSINWLLLPPACHVIVDDLGFYVEPFFADGPVAAAADAAVTAGCVYVSAAGNDALDHWQGNYTNVAVTTGGSVANGWNAQNFGGGDYSINIQIPPAAAGPPVVPSNVFVHLQWNDQFGASSSDYDLYATNTAETTIISQSVTAQNGTQNPHEVVGVQNNSTVNPLTVKIIVRRFNAPGPNIIELFALSNAGTVWADVAPQAADAIFGHPAAVSVIAVAAVDHAPNGNCAVENFSSHGPSTISFPAVVSRGTPDVAGIDNVAVTGSGGFGSPFPGTSAAAPHVAAMAALMRACNPGATPFNVRFALKENPQCPPAVPPHDNVIGFGLVDARGGTATICPGVFCPDFDGTGDVNMDDLLYVLTRWGNPGCGGADPCLADMTLDGRVDIDDLLAVINGWGNCPNP